ncbi:MAG TPA: hypoxanthine phosphoribosyltransferase [Pseudonocardiaceae bacterium]|nr:hypoxanthine phosphoribosyltransferase [Pseudonocardiaceae bacterium]
MMTIPTGELGPVLLRAEQLKQRIDELGEEISGDYDGLDPLFVGILKGSAVFAADLARAVTIPLSMDWVSLSTYGIGSTARAVRLRKGLDREINDRHVLVVDDILDTGTTLHWLLEYLSSQAPASLESCVLLRKSDSVVKPVRPRYVGFDISENLVAGYGIDYAEHYRNMPHICSVRVPEIVVGTAVCGVPEAGHLR